MDRMAPMVAMEEDRVGRNEPSRVLIQLGKLLEETEAGLHFSGPALEKVGALIEVAARVRDVPRGVEALYDVVRLSFALDQEGHHEAAGALHACLRASPAALLRLRDARHQEAGAYARFEAFSERKELRRAPQIEDEAPEQSICLKDLLEPGAGLRRERAAAEAAKSQRTRPSTSPSSPSSDREAKPARRRFGVN